MIDISQQAFNRAPKDIQNALGLWCQVVFPGTNIAALRVADDGRSGEIYGRAKNPAQQVTGQFLWLRIEQFDLRVPELVCAHFRQN